ncbi:MAG TPA: DUF4349 domain-containing protein [Terriglobia bacterium]|nr:DUF4349 domain-containing protein [Terriglobia bacterium]
MIRDLLPIILGSVLLSMTGCHSRTAASFGGASSRGGGGSRDFGTVRTVSEMRVDPVASRAEPLKRYIAERHEVEIIAPESELQKSWQSVIDFCATIQCEVISSSVTSRTDDSVPSGTVTLRVAPEDLTKLLIQIQKLGRIAQHSTEREDKTTAVVDTEAKIKNLTAFRDNLRVMLAKPSATVKDLIEIQEQLTQTQSELDSETRNRKILANETEKVAVQLSFRIKESRRTVRGLGAIWDALGEAGSDFADSTAFLITAIVSVIPWLFVIASIIWLLARAWRKRNRKRPAASTPPQATP